jgi:hypothetical protein
MRRSPSPTHTHTPMKLDTSTGTGTGTPSRRRSSSRTRTHPSISMARTMGMVDSTRMPMSMSSSTTAGAHTPRASAGRDGRGGDGDGGGGIVVARVLVPLGLLFRASSTRCGCDSRAGVSFTGLCSPSDVRTAEMEMLAPCAPFPSLAHHEVDVEPRFLFLFNSGAGRGQTAVQLEDTLWVFKGATLAASAASRRCGPRRRGESSFSLSFAFAPCRVKIKW